MKKGIFLLAVLTSTAVFGKAQTAAVDTLMQDNADFTFTESQLDDDNDNAQTIASISDRKDPYQSEVGYAFSAMRFKVRALDNQYSDVYLNGLRMNDLELGRYSYSLLGGMNDATRNKEGLLSSDYNTFGYTQIGGGENINLRPSMFAQGNKLSVSGCNRNYTLRAMYTHATGFNRKGWAFALTTGVRWSNMETAFVQGTFYNSFSLFFGAEKRFNDHHNLSLVVFGAPTERAQQGASTEEVYWLTNNRYYNPNWGYQNGKKRNAKIVHDFAPTAIATWDFKIDEKSKVTTTAAFKYSMYSNSALGWSGNAYDPRPDYYKNLPSSIFNVYDSEINNETYLSEHRYYYDDYQSLYDRWQNADFQQINWDRMYYVNQESAKAGGETLYYLERRHNDQMMLALSSVFDKTVNQHHKFAFGINVNSTKGMHYKTMEDKLGGGLYTDVDKFSVNDYGRDSQEAQNDLNRPNRLINVGDIFGYNYNVFVSKQRGWGQYQYSSSLIDVSASAYAEGTSIERVGLMRNGRAANNSYGSSGTAWFLSGGAKATLNIHPTAAHNIVLSVGASANAPHANNAFVAARMQNNFVDNLVNEKVLNADLSYLFQIGKFSGKVGGYFAQTMDGVEQTAFYDDSENRFVYLSMNNVQKRYYGVEAALKYQITSALSVKLTGTYGEAEYINNPNAQISYEGTDAKTLYELNRWMNSVTHNGMTPIICAKGLHVGSTPLAAVQLGVNYNVKGWFFEVDLNYYDRVYIGWSQYRRKSNLVNKDRTGYLFNYYMNGVDEYGNPAYADFTPESWEENGGVKFDTEGNIVETSAGKQEKFKGGFMLDASIGKFIRFSKGRSLSINLSLQNITNNQNLRTGGYEQNRSDIYSSGEERPYQFSKNAKYYYAQTFNFFLNLGFKF